MSQRTLFAMPRFTKAAPPTKKAKKRIQGEEAIPKHVSKERVPEDIPSASSEDPTPLNSSTKEMQKDFCRK